MGPYQLTSRCRSRRTARGTLPGHARDERGDGPGTQAHRRDEDGSGPLTDWRVRCILLERPRLHRRGGGTLPLDLRPRQTLRGGTGVHVRRPAQRSRSMARAFPASNYPDTGGNEPRPWWRLGLTLSSAAAVCALAFALVHLAPVPQPPSDPDSLARAEPAPMSHEVPTNTEVPFTGNSVVDTVDRGLPALAHPFPAQALQRAEAPSLHPSCRGGDHGRLLGASRAEGAVPGGAPNEYQGKCYTTSMLPPPTPQSLGP